MMIISKILKKIAAKHDVSPSTKAQVQTRTVRTARRVKTVALESLPISRPRTTAEILSAYKAGHFAELSPKQAGL